MNEKSGRRLYEPPRARDLSAFSVSGQGPEGVCRSGAYPYYSCVAGPNFVGSCITGSTVDTSACLGGGYHTTPTCRNVGSNAATICVSGQAQQM